MGGGTATRPRPSTGGALPSLQHVRWTAHFFEALRWVDPLASTRGPTSDLPRSRRRRRDCPDPRAPTQFDGKPFNKGSMAASVIATVAGGAGVICFAAFFQNKKHGFIK